MSLTTITMLISKTTVAFSKPIRNCSRLPVLPRWPS
ncbi:hypothetical protein Patl1_29915 [Pistacia atlantica]|uniref:Uncharacterized protein n=1 Tax=Pistacia atlantica TaxID=434234 RepID=A0ACC1A9P5_9ROSI|nr:hypothetical protein Patl1_29915 [Pistacia atlantica]